MDKTMVTVKVFNVASRLDSANAEVTLIDNSGLSTAGRTGKDGEVDFYIPDPNQEFNIQVKSAGHYFTKHEQVVFSNIENRAFVGIQQAPRSFPVTLNSDVKVPGLDGSVTVRWNREDEYDRGEGNALRYQIKGNNLAVSSNNSTGHFSLRPSRIKEGYWMNLDPTGSGVTLTDFDGYNVDVRVCDEGPGMISLGFDSRYLVVRQDA